MRPCTNVTGLDMLVHHGGFVGCICLRHAVLCGRQSWATILPVDSSPSPDSRAEAPTLRTSASTDLSCIGVRCCIACRDVALLLQHNLPHWRWGLQGELAALYQGATRAVQDKLSRNVSCLLICSSHGGRAVVKPTPLPEWLVN